MVKFEVQARKLLDEESKSQTYRLKLDKIETTTLTNETDFIKFKEDITLLEDELNKIQSSNDMLKNVNINLKTEIEFLKSDSESVFKEKENELRKEIKSLKSENKTLSTELKGMNKQLEMVNSGNTKTASKTNTAFNPKSKTSSTSINKSEDNNKIIELEQVNIELQKKISDIEVNLLFKFNSSKPMNIKT